MDEIGLPLRVKIARARRICGSFSRGVHKVVEGTAGSVLVGCRWVKAPGGHSITVTGPEGFRVRTDSRAAHARAGEGQFSGCMGRVQGREREQLTTRPREAHSDQLRQQEPDNAYNHEACDAQQAHHREQYEIGLPVGHATQNAR
jgi:hypothetical protein